MKSSRHPFTLIEIVVCMAILGLAAAFVGIQIHRMVADHTFESNVASLISELKKCQLVAACNQIDIEVVIAKEDKHWAFWIETDETLPYFLSRKRLMSAATRIESQGRAVDREVIHFYPSGRFDKKKIVLIHRDDQRHEIDMQNPLFIAHKAIGT